MPRVILYTRNGCHLCAQARKVIERARQRVEFELAVVDIDIDAALRSRYNDDIPVIALEGRDLFRWSVDEDALVDRVRAEAK
jgi:glutaredoxin